MCTYTIYSVHIYSFVSLRSHFFLEREIQERDANILEWKTDVHGSCLFLSTWEAIDLFFRGS